MKKELKPKTASCNTLNDNSRRSFARRLMGIGFLSSLSLTSVPEAALAWLDGGFSQREDLADALKVLVKTYSDTRPYPHKFYDALVKDQLRNLDFALRKGVWKEYVEHDVKVLGIVVDRHIRKAVEKFGKDALLWGIFERTSCSYQLYEHIDVKEGERSFPCPYKNILEATQKTMGTFKITWEDVHSKWCIPRWNGFAKKVDLELKVEPGEVCRVKVI